MDALFAPAHTLPFLRFRAVSLRTFCARAMQLLRLRCCMFLFFAPRSICLPYMPLSHLRIVWRHLHLIKPYLVSQVLFFFILRRAALVLMSRLNGMR